MLPWVIANPGATVDEVCARFGYERGDLASDLDAHRHALAVAPMAADRPVDVAVFGGTKNGLMGVEAVVFFDPAHAWEFELRRKRGGTGGVGTR